MMKKLLLSISCIALLLSGCLDAEKFSLSLDLMGKTSEVGLLNIVSDSKDDNKIEGDFEELIGKAYGKEDKANGSGKIISVKLYEKDGHLESITTYAFKNNEEMLREYEIKTDKKGDFIFDLSKGGNKDLEYVSSNGAYIEEGNNRFVRWDGNSSTLEIKLKNKAFDPKNKSLLPYWLKWKKEKAATSRPS